ncbi:hypothetical protein H0V99_01325 [Candidatus Saccharibacteria bacterium]|nr:hypothetical protein [Candidatus Saccharibacteria bacterium]
MSDILVQERINYLQKHYSVDILASMHLGSASEKAKGHAQRVRELALKAGGLVSFFVVGESFHEDQHKAFCDEMEIDNNLFERHYPILISTDRVTVLHRMPQLHDESETIYGVHYYVEHILFDRD